MNQDSYFYIGKSHKQCQDYALASSLDSQPFIIISDGCSGSENTDFGSRLLVKSAELELQQILLDPGKPRDPLLLLLSIFTRAVEAFGSIPGLQYTCLDATLLLAYKNQDKITVICSGDGVVAAVKKDGSMLVKTISYADNAPIYLNYLQDAKRKEELLKTYNCEKTITTYDGLKNIVSSEVSANEIETFEFSVKDYATISLFSDGVESFSRQVQTATSKQYCAEHVVDVVEELVNYKGYVGNFVQRRCQKFLKECSEAGTIHADDLSAATIWLGE